MPSPAVVAVFNSNVDVIEMLRLAIENVGFVVVSAHVDAIRRGEVSLTDFVDEHDPQVIVYDVVPPYDRSWRFLEHLRSTPNIRGRRFVITSTNAARAIERRRAARVRDPWETSRHQRDRTGGAGRGGGDLPENLRKA